MTKAGGATAGGTATTDSTGTAVWTYKVAQKDPHGAYSASSTAVYKSQTTTSNTVTFTVN